MAILASIIDCTGDTTVSNGFERESLPTEKASAECWKSPRRNMISSGFDGRPRACLQHLAGLQLPHVIIAHLSSCNTARRPDRSLYKACRHPSAVCCITCSCRISVSSQSQLPNVAGAVDAQCSSPCPRIMSGRKINHRQGSPTYASSLILHPD